MWLPALLFPLYLFIYFFKVPGFGRVYWYLFMQANRSCHSALLSSYKWTKAHDRNGKCIV